MAKYRKDNIDSFSGLYFRSPIIENNNADNNTITEGIGKVVETPGYDRKDDELIQNTSTKRKEKAEKGRPKSTKETKVRKSIGLYPSQYSDLEKIAYVDREDSVTAIIDRLVKDYIRKNQDKIQEYHQIKNKNKG